MNNEKNYACMELLVPMIKEHIKNGSEAKLVVTGYSMFPMLCSRRDSVILKKAEKLHKYDIPLYQRENGNYVLHRIVKIENDCYHIAGDNEIKIEYPVKEEQIIAVVIGFYRKGKYYSVNNIFYKTYARLWCLLLPYRYKILPVLLRIRSKTGGRSAKGEK